MKTITEDVAAILRDSTITNDRVVLPDRQLDRKLYLQVHDVLAGYGGKWNRKHRAHIFSVDPRERLKEALSTGRARNQKQELGEFYTPAWLVEKMIGHARLEPGLLVLEPSAGDGRIGIACVERGCSVDVYEIDPAKQRELTPPLVLMGGDFLTYSAERKYDRVLMNPPFAKGQDIAHVTRAFDFLKTGGILVAITAVGWTFHGTKKAVAFRELVESNGEWYELPEEAFSESGTKVKTALVILRRAA